MDVKKATPSAVRCASRRASAAITFGDGRLGHGGTHGERVPRLVEALAGKKVAVASGRRASYSSMDRGGGAGYFGVRALWDAGPRRERE